MINTFKDYINMRKERLNELIQKYNLDIDKHRLEELMMVEKFLND